MASEATKVWGPMRKALRRFGMLKRIENTSGSGQPDVYYCVKGTAGWVELKHLDSWPVRESTLTDLGIRKSQIFWMNDHLQNGGKSFVFARVGEGWLLIPAYAGLTKATKKEWIKRAILHTTNGMEWNRLMDILLH